MKPNFLYLSSALAGVLLFLLVAPDKALGIQDEQFTHNITRTDLGESIGREMRKLKDIGFSGVILVAHEGKVIFVRSNGIADPKQEPELRPNSLFELASLTKSFTATAAMILAQQGKLDLDASISEYLPGVPENCRPIEVRHLLQHTSGIPPTNYGRTNDGLPTAVKTMLDGGPRHRPGTHHEYWNQGYILLSEIIATAAGEPYVDVCRRLIFEPAAMTGTCFTGDESPDGYTPTIGTGNIGPPRSCLEHPYGSYGLQYRGTGGIVSNVWDLWKFHCALRDNVLLDKKHTAIMFDSGEMDYALGWKIGKAAGQHAYQSHGGTVRGFDCHFRRYPDSDGCIVVLLNKDERTTHSLANVLERFLFAGQMPDPLDAQVAAKFVGEYRESAGRRITIELIQGNLTYAIHWSPGAPVSRGYVMKNKAGDVVLYQPGDITTVDWQLDDREKQVASISFMKLTFQRRK